MNQHGFVSYEELIAEISRLQLLVDHLEHQHLNDEFANKFLLEKIERIENAA